MMNGCILCLIVSLLSSAHSAPTSYDNIQKRLNDLSKQVEVFADQFNRSVDFLANKIDENTRQLMEFINSHHIDSHSGN